MNECDWPIGWLGRGQMNGESEDMKMTRIGHTSGSWMKTEIIEFFFFLFYKFFPITFRNISCCCPTVEMKSSRKKWRSKNDRLCQIAESREVKGEEKRKWHSDMKTVERWNWDVTTGEVQIRQIQADKGMIYQLIIKNDNDQRRGSLCEEWIVETNRFETCLIVENAR